MYIWRYKAHLHKPLWKYIQGKHVFWNRIIFQQCFTFIFAYYGFYFLDFFKSLIPSIVLHCYCNYLGPPNLNSSKFESYLENLKYHLACIFLFFLYVHYMIWFVDILMIINICMISIMIELCKSRSMISIMVELCKSRSIKSS